MPEDSPLRTNRLSRISWSMIFLLVTMVASASHTSAHRVILFAYAEEDRVFTESYFSDGKRCQNSRIEVFDGLGNKLLEGKTDNNGEFSFKPPKKTDLRIVLTVSMGHRDEYTVPARDLAGGAAAMTRKAEHDQAGKKLFRGEKVVTDALDEELKPITGLPAKRQNEGISFVGVVGGIGFIFGIMGIILYFRSKRRRYGGTITW